VNRSSRSRAALLPAALATAVALGGCAYNEALGRNQLLLVDNAGLAQAGAQAWAATLQKTPRSRSAADNERVRRVGQRLVEAAGLQGQRWEYAVFEDPSVNAFALPGGYIGVNTGLLRLVRNDDQLATVIGHEIAHNLANHAAERYSQTAVTSVGLQVAGSALGGGDPNTARQIASLGGVGAQLGVLLPFSRRHELEADQIGVDLMARAGYRASAAPELWRLMAARSGGGRTSSFASTHPTEASRIQALEEHIRARGYR
jgi:predicted Zn-dependent protease